MQGVGPESWRSACRSPRCRLTETISCYFYCIPLENPHSPNHLFLFPLSFPHFHLPALSLPLSFPSPSLSLYLSLSLSLGPVFALFVPFFCSIPRVPVTQLLGQISITNKSLVYIMGLQVRAGYSFSQHVVTVSSETLQLNMFPLDVYII